MKTRRDYILDRFSLTDALRWENLSTAWNSVGMAATSSTHCSW
ncbi:hypothetical protein NKG94_21760 [Micromonospora sp. M12]